MMNVVSREPDAALADISARCEIAYRLGSLDELATLLEEVDGDIDTIDLIGHSSRGHSYLRIGPTKIDMMDPAVSRFFSRLANSRLLERRGVQRIRLLGCGTAVTPAAQRTMARLARVLGIEIWGTTKALMKGHYNAAGFNPAFDQLLVESADLPAPREWLHFNRAEDARAALAAVSNR